MSAAKKIRMLLVQREMTLTDLAKRLHVAPSTLSDKLRRDNFREKELKEIADILNFDFTITFTDKETGETF